MSTNAVVSPPAGDTITAMPPEAALCRQCALCCDGTLFDRVPLRAGEPLPELLRGAVLRAALTQRCPALDGTGACRVYATRPLVCRGFSCLLLTALRDGEVGLDEALAVVAAARDRQARPRAVVEPGDEPLLQRAQATPAARRLALEQLEHLRFHFTGQRPPIGAHQPEPHP